MASNTLSTVRRSVFPEDQDTWESIAAREMPSVSVEEATSQLQSWNLHVFMRRTVGKDSQERSGEILPSDVIFLEPPLA